MIIVTILFTRPCKPNAPAGDESYVSCSDYSSCEVVGYYSLVCFTYLDMLYLPSVSVARTSGGGPAAASDGEIVHQSICSSPSPDL